MSAKEMFEELGFIQVVENDPILYQDKFVGKNFIEFYNNEFCINNVDNEKMFYDYKFFKAIQKQIEELGWE